MSTGDYVLHSISQYGIRQILTQLFKDCMKIHMLLLMQGLLEGGFSRFTTL